MSSGTIVAVVVAIIVVAAVVVLAAMYARSRRLRRQFGPEYDRAVADSGSRLKAESELADRERRVRKLDIRPLDAAELERYQSQWSAIQAQFVDSPDSAVSGAQSLITSVMSERGYPTDDLDQIMADLSVEHAQTLDQFRTATDLSSRAAEGSASTEDLRQAMVHYRALFTELLGAPGTSAPQATADPTIAGPDGLPPTGPDPVSPATSPAGAVSTDPASPDPFSPDPFSPDPVSAEPEVASPASEVASPADSYAADASPADTDPDYIRSIPAQTDPAGPVGSADSAEVADEDASDPDPADEPPARKPSLAERISGKR
jgi:hypothetical protein